MEKSQRNITPVVGPWSSVFGKTPWLVWVGHSCPTLLTGTPYRFGQTAHLTFTASLRHRPGISFRPRTFREQSSRHQASRYLSNRARVDRGLNHSVLKPSAISTGTTYHKSSGIMWTTTKSMSFFVNTLPLHPALTL